MPKIVLFKISKIHMLCKPKLSTYFQKLQTNLPSCYQNCTKIVLTNRCYFGTIGTMRNDFIIFL